MTTTVLTRFPNDQKMAALEAVTPFTMRHYPDAWQALASAVFFQQVDGKVAEARVDRIRNELGRFPTPDDILQAKEGTWRAHGLPEAREKTLRALAQRVRRPSNPNGDLILEGLAEKKDSLITSLLRQTKGVGPWTVEMFLIFHCRRDDVFLPRDIGLQEAVKRLDGLAERPEEDALLARAKQWEPYRTRAAYLLWRSLPNFPEPGFGPYGAVPRE